MRDAIKKLHSDVAVDATRHAYGYCGGMSEKAEHHAIHIIQALCRVLGITEADLVEMRKRRDFNINGQDRW